MPAINTNVAALFAQQSLNVNERVQSSAMRQLSTGNRINTASDDAAGMAIGQNMTSQVKGLNQAVRNVNDGINMMQTAEGALGETSNMLQRMRELAVQSANGSYSSDQRIYLQTEFVALSSQIGKIWMVNVANCLDQSKEFCEVAPGPHFGLLWKCHQ